MFGNTLRDKIQRQNPEKRMKTVWIWKLRLFFFINSEFHCSADYSFFMAYRRPFITKNDKTVGPRLSLGRHVHCAVLRPTKVFCVNIQRIIATRVRLG